MNKNARILRKKIKNIYNKNVGQNFIIPSFRDLTDHIPSNFALLLNLPLISHYLAVLSKSTPTLNYLIAYVYES